MNRTQGVWSGPAVREDLAGQVGCPADLAAVIRPTCPADVPALGGFFAGLSARSRYLRFFAPVTPGTAMLRLLCGEADDADAVIAVQGTEVIGHAMAVDRAVPGGPDGRGRGPGAPDGPGDGWPRTADVGMVVADAWQGRGLGSALMRALITRAWARGVTSVAMDVLPGNRRVLDMITGHWPSARVDHLSDCTTICVSLLPYAPRYPHAEAARDDLAASWQRLVPGDVA
jgi:GNAT superfamily N-acetyltransferase